MVQFDPICRYLNRMLSLNEQSVTKISTLGFISIKTYLPDSWLRD
jgi:hypothetical protein